MNIFNISACERGVSWKLHLTHLRSITNVPFLPFFYLFFYSSFHYYSIWSFFSVRFAYRQLLKILLKFSSMCVRHAGSCDSLITADVNRILSSPEHLSQRPCFCFTLVFSPWLLFGCLSSIALTSQYSTGSVAFKKWRMPSSGMWRRVGLVRTDVSKERLASIFRVEGLIS
jgi:hypothetical protein